jgi:hypothetical protein
LTILNWWITEKMGDNLYIRFQIIRPKNMYRALEIDKINLTIMGVKFSDLKTMEGTANALGSNMFEGFEPTPKGIEIIRDYVIGKISLSELVVYANQKAYV